MSRHDTRLKEMIKLLKKMPYASLDNIQLAQPEASKIVESLYVTDDIQLPLNLYRELFIESVKAKGNGGMYLLNISENNFKYFEERFVINDFRAKAPYYTALLVFTHPSIRLPIEIGKKIASYIELEASVFKPDLLVMLRIASQGKPKTLSSRLNHLYKELCDHKLSLNALDCCDQSHLLPHNSHKEAKNRCNSHTKKIDDMWRDAVLGYIGYNGTIHEYSFSRSFTLDEYIKQRSEDHTNDDDDCNSCS